MLDETFSNWEYVRSFLPQGWREQLTKLGVLRFGRKFKGKEDTLLRLLLLHLSGGISLRETAAFAKLGGLVEISDVGLLKRLKKSERFFKWGLSELLESGKAEGKESFPSGLRPRLLDASVVKEPGNTGSQWRIHYSVDLRSLACDEAHVTGLATGESLSRFEFRKGDLAIGDRAYATPSGLLAVTESGADALVRFTPRRLPLWTQDGGAPFQLLERLRELEPGEAASWNVQVKSSGKSFAGRVCVMRRLERDAAQERELVLKEAKRKRRKASSLSLEMAGYVLLFTTLPPEKAKTDALLKAYRLRWQVEMVFKRLKSILGLGHLHKWNPDTVKAWLTGKLFASALIETLIRSGESFFPSRRSGEDASE